MDGDLLTTVHMLAIQKARDYNLQCDKDFRFSRFSEATILPDIIPNGQPPSRVSTPKRTPTTIAPKEDPLAVIENLPSPPTVPRSPNNINSGSIARTNSTSRPKARAIYAYNAEGQKEMGFTQGEILIILSQDSKGWWFAQSTTNPGKTGFVPSNYLEVIA